MYKGGSSTFTDAKKYCEVSAVNTDTLFQSLFFLYFGCLIIFSFFIYFSLRYSTFLDLVSFCPLELKLDEINFEVK